MIVLVSGGTATMRKFAGNPYLGVLFVPASGNTAASLWPDAVWAADNSAYTHFDAGRFVDMLGRLREVPGCQFVAAPDVVAQPIETLRRFRLWEPMIHALGFPVALVGQDGLKVSQVPWDSLDAFFVGGSTDWKLGTAARDLVSYAQSKGKWCHMGRVNSRKRMHYAERIGCDSIDGQSFSVWSERYVPKAIEWATPAPLFREVPR